MGTKRRILTQGQKFVKKHRIWLDNTDGDLDDRITSERFSGKVVSALEVEEQLNTDGVKNGTITFKAFVEGKLAAEDADELDLFVDGVAVDAVTLLTDGVDTGGPFTIGELTKGDDAEGGKAAPLAWPAQVVARDDQRLITKDNGTVLSLDPGYHTLKAVVHGESEGSMETTFTVSRSVITTQVADGEVLMADDDDGGERNVLIALQHLEFSGSHQGEHESYGVSGAAGKGFKVEVLIKEDTADSFVAAVPNDALVAGDWTVEGVLDADAGDEKYPAGDLANFLKESFAAPAAGPDAVAKKAVIRVIFTPKDAADALIPEDATTFDHEISINPA